MDQSNQYAQYSSEYNGTNAEIIPSLQGINTAGFTENCLSRKTRQVPDQEYDQFTTGLDPAQYQRFHGMAVRQAVAE